MNRRSAHKIPAFTIFEVTVVLAIMSVLITIISSALNRFQEQLKVATDVRAELNQWYALRSVLWQDLYYADSVQMQQAELHLFSDGKATAYRIQEGIFERSRGGEWVSGVVPAERLFLDTTGARQICHLEFLWKEQPMDLHFAVQPSEDVRINAYFDRINE